MRGSSGSHWPQSLPILGTPVDVPQPRMRTFTPPCLNNLKKLAVVASASCSGSSPLSSATKAAVSATNAGSHFWPRCGTGARKGESVSTSIWSAGSHLAVACRSGRVLEGHDARQRDVEAEIETLARKLGRASEAMEHAGHAPFLHRALRGSRRCRPRPRACGPRVAGRSAAQPRYAPRNARAAPRGRTCRNNNRGRIRRSR